MNKIQNLDNGQGPENRVIFFPEDQKPLLITEGASLILSDSDPALAPMQYAMGVEDNKPLLLAEMKTGTVSLQACGEAVEHLFEAHASLWATLTEATENLVQLADTVKDTPEFRRLTKKTIAHEYGRYFRSARKAVAFLERIHGRKEEA